MVSLERSRDFTPHARLSCDTFSELHELIALCPEAGIFRRNGALYSQIMFELQESIDEAEKELEGKQRDLETCLPRLAASPSEEDHQLINENITKIRSEIERAKVERRKCVYDYGKYLCVFEKIAALPDPSGHYYKTFHEVVKQCNDAAILPSVYRSIDAPIHRDMCALKDVPDIEPFSRMVIFRLFTNLAKRPRFNRFFKDKVTGGRGIMVQDVVQKTQVMITCVVLPLFFSGSVVALSMVHSMNARIAIIAVLLLVFELSSLFFMGLSQKEMIIALSAYAAVLVVFANGNISSH